MKEIKFVSYGEPVAKGRPRFCMRGKFPGTYTPKKTVNAENDLKAQALKFRPKSLIMGPIEIDIGVYRSMPKSLSKNKRQLALDKLLRPISRPDWDNYAKLVCDALNGLFWKDDSQVVTAVVKKYYSDTPRIEVSMTYAEGGE